MAQTVHFTLLKETTLIKELEIENAPIPRVGEVIHAPGSAANGMDWYMTSDVRYTMNIEKQTMEVEVTAHAASSDEHRGIDDYRLRLMHSTGWVSTDIEN